MKVKIIIIYLFLCFCVQLKSSVILEEVNIESEFYGPFSKNTAEFIFYNDSNDNEQEGICYFRLNSSAFISNLWLEIDGRLVLDETFRVDTGTKIYKKITTKRKDPALLKKRDEDSYVLSIYPFNKYEKRRAIIEFYSTLETIENQLTWIFKTENYISYTNKDSTIINMKSIFNFPLRTKISHNNFTNLHQNNKLFFTLSKNELALKIQFPTNLNTVIENKLRIFGYFNEILEIAETSKTIKEIHLIPNVPEFVENFIKDYNNTNYKLYNTVEKDDVFLSKFLEYIETEHLPNSPYYQVFANWFSKKDSIFYKDKNLNLISSSDSLNNYNGFCSIPCSFLKVFFEYLSILNQNYQEQVKSRFLTKHTAKLVLEKNKQIDKIRKNALKHELKYIPIEGTTSRFVIYEEIPIPIKRTFPKYSDRILKLFDIEGEVWLEAEIFEDGKVGQVLVKQSLISFVDALAIQAVKQWEFVPAKSGGKSVACWVTFPIGFDCRDNDSKHITQSDSLHTVIERELKIENDILCEINFDLYKSKTIELYSKNFFDLLMKNPELVQITYLFSIQNKYSRIGLLINSKESVLIVK